MSNGVRRRSRYAQVTDTLTPLSAGVAALGASLDDLTIEGRPWRSELGGAALNASLERTTDGASTVTVHVHDPDGALLRSPLLANPYTVTLDGLSFSSVKLRRQDRTTLELTMEATNAARLRVKGGARKAQSNTTSRAAFGLQLVRETAGDPIPFYSPQLAVPKALKSQGAVIANTDVKNAQREPGFSPGFKGTVKGATADQAQRQVIETTLDVGTALKAPRKALLSAILTVIVESGARNLSGGDRDSTGAFQQRASMGWPASGDVAKDANAYYKGLSGHPGAIGVLKANPGMKAPDVSQAVQASGVPDAYKEWVDEGTKWLDAYLQGRAAGGATTDGKAKAALERQADETTWDALGRLATDVNWIRFEAADIVYFMAQTDLLGSQARMSIEDYTPGVADLTFDADSGKPVTTVELTVDVNAWQAPPGTVVDIGDSLGSAAAGRFQVTSIRNPMYVDHPSCDVTLTRPTPETADTGAAAAPTKKKGAKNIRSSSTTSGADRMVKWAMSQVGVAEGSSKQRTYANALGYSPSLPWCSLFIGYGLKTECGFKSLPSNPAYSGAWLDWSGGKKVDASKLLPGDIVVFDWGDGGMTDHVALYIGGGNVIGGNQSNAVTKVPINRGAIVGAVRPNYG